MAQKPVVQYQVLAEPVFVSVAVTTTVDRWYQPLSLPVFAKPGLNTAEHPFAVAWQISTAKETTTIDRWWQQLSVPAVLAKRGLPAAEQQALALLVPQAKETVSIDRWMQLLSVPSVLGRAFPAAEQQAHTEPVSTRPETTSLDRWYQPLSLPTPPKAGLAPAQQQAHTEPVSESPETVTVDRWLVPLSQPIFTRTLPVACAMPALAWSTFTPAVVAVTVASWLVPFATPVPTVSRHALMPPPTGPPNTSPETTSLDRWYQPLSVLPTPRTPPFLAAQQQAFTAPLSESPETTSIDRWWQPLSVPVLRVPSVASLPAHTEPVSTQPETTSLDRWYQPLSVAPPAKAGLPVGQQQALAWSTFTPAAAATSGWLEPFSTPIFKRRVQYQVYANPPPQVSAAPTVFVDGWYPPFSLPPRQPGFAATLQPNYVAPVSLDPEATSLDRWYQPLSLPVFVRALPVSSMPALAWSTFTPPAAAPTSVDRWWQPLSLPPRQPPFAAAQQAVLAEPLSEAPETTTVDRWWQPLSVPVLRTPSVASQPVHTEPVSLSPESTSLDRWYQPLSVPPVLRFTMPAAQQQAHTEPVSIARETVTEDRWHQPLSIPSVLTRPGLLASQQQAYAAPLSEAPETTTVDRWFAPFSLPVWQKPGLAAAQQQALAWSTFTPAPTATTDMRWFAALSEPVRPKPSVASFQAHTEPVSLARETVSIDRWLQPLSLPPPPKAALAAAQQQALVWSGFTPFHAPSFDWFQPLSLPPPPKPGLRPEQQQAHAEPVSLARETTTLDRWYQPLSMPVKIPPGLLAAEQGAFFAYPGLPQVTFSVTINPLAGSFIFTGFAPTVTAAPSGIFTLSNSDILIEAFGRIGVEPPAITRHHLLAGRTAINLEVQDWTNQTTTMWSVVSGTITLVPGQVVYTLPANLVDMFELTMTDTHGNSRFMLPMERSQYAAIVNKLAPGEPSYYWLQMLQPPQITIWQAPMLPNILTYYGLQQIQDSNLGTAEVPNVPYRGIDVLCARVAVRLCEEFGPRDRRANAAMKKEKIALAEIAWNKFQRRDQETGSTRISLVTKKYRRIK